MHASKYLLTDVLKGKLGFKVIMAILCEKLYILLGNSFI